MDSSPVIQVQEGCRWFPEVKYGALWDCWSDKGDHEEHGQEASEPSERSEWQQSGRERCCHAGERPKLSHRILLALLQLLLLLRVLRRWGHVISSQPQRQRLSCLLCDEHHSSHWGRVCRTDAGGLWWFWGFRSSPGSDGGCEGPRHGCGLSVHCALGQMTHTQCRLYAINKKFC